MTPDDLATEMDAACLGLPVVDARIALVRRGVPLETLRGPWAVGYTRIETDGNTYQPCPSGRPAFIIPEPIRANDDWADPDWQILDLVAVTPTAPAEIYTRRGLAWALGAYNARYAVYSGEPLTVHRTPFAWLRANRQGIAIVDASEMSLHLSWCSAVIGADVMHARQLRSQLLPPEIPVPQVLVPNHPEMHAHA